MTRQISGAPAGKQQRAERPAVVALVAPAVGLIGFFGLWELLVRVFRVKTFILPGPLSTLGAMAEEPGFLARQAAVTGREALIGLFVAFVVACALAVPMSRSRFAEAAVAPVATLLQVVPLVGYAPAFVIWLGTGQPPIIAVTALVSFVPI